MIGLLLIVGCKSKPHSISIPKGYCLAVNAHEQYIVRNSAGERLGRDVGMTGHTTFEWSFDSPFFPYLFNDSNAAKEALEAYLITIDTTFNCVTNGK